MQQVSGGSDSSQQAKAALGHKFDDIEHELLRVSIPWMNRIDRKSEHSKAGNRKEASAFRVRHEHQLVLACICLSEA